MFRSLLLVFAVAAFSPRLMPSALAAEFQILSQSVTVDRADRTTGFTVTFNQPPDFFQADAFDRPNNAFQYVIDSQVSFESEGADVKVVRGPEIRFGGGIPIRDSINPTGADFPHAEGWGPKRGAVPFDLSGTVLTFTVPWQMLGEDDGRFSYHVMAFENGSQTSDIGAVVISLASPLWIGAAGCAGLPLALRHVKRLTAGG